jgi:membrane protease YdiL (CAAX protease family)
LIGLIECFRVTDLDAAPPQFPSVPGAGAALLQVVIASGVPTQFALAILLSALGMRTGTMANPVPLFLAVVTLTDSVVVLALIHVFLTAGGERPRAVLVGGRPMREVVLGLMLFPVLFLGLLTLIATVARLCPALHTVPINPYETFFHRPADAALFAVVVVIAGGVREEVQRGFVLHRFGQRLGGTTVGLFVWSLAFGAGHYGQGWDVAIGMAGAGAFWGWLYLRRGSVIAPMVNHAAFDLLQVVKMAFLRGLGA